MKPATASVCWAVLALTWLFTASAHAHGTGFALEPDVSVFAARFYYTGGEPMAYARVNIQGPGADVPEHQNGRTDCKGMFAFCPDRPGTWQVMVNDRRGHRVRASIDVPDTLLPDPSMSGHLKPETPGWLAVVAGLSLLFNVWLIIGAVKRNRAQRDQ